MMSPLCFVMVIHDDNEGKKVTMWVKYDKNLNFAPFIDVDIQLENAVQSLRKT